MLRDDDLLLSGELLGIPYSDVTSLSIMLGILVLATAGLCMTGYLGLVRFHFLARFNASCKGVCKLQGLVQQLQGRMQAALGVTQDRSCSVVAYGEGEVATHRKHAISIPRIPFQRLHCRP